MNMKFLALVLVAMMALFVAGCAKTAPAPAAPEAPAAEAPVTEEAAPEETVEEEEEAPAPVVATEVMVNRQNFDPEELNVGVGSTLTFKNMDDRTHIVTVKGIVGAKSPRLSAEETWAYTFEEAGEFEVMDVIFGYKMMVTVE